MRFFKRVDGLFHLVQEKRHHCNEVLPSVKRLWVRQKAKELLEEERKVSPSSLQEIINEKFGVDVHHVMASNSLADARKAIFEEDAPFGLLRSFLGVLEAINAGTVTSLVEHDNVFQRAFVAPGMCIEAFQQTTRVVGLDACHVKARYGGLFSP